MIDMPVKNANEIVQIASNNQPVSLTQVYLLSLSGIGEYEHKWVSKEVWDWVQSDNQISYTKAYWEEDKEVPQELKDNWQAYHGSPFEPISVTARCQSNDRALAAFSIEGLDVDAVDIYDMRCTLKAQGFELIDSWDGYIY